MNHNVKQQLLLARTISARHVRSYLWCYSLPNSSPAFGDPLPNISNLPFHCCCRSWLSRLEHSWQYSIHKKRLISSPFPLLLLAAEVCVIVCHFELPHIVQAGICNGLPLSLMVTHMETLHTDGPFLLDFTVSGAKLLR